MPEEFNFFSLWMKFSYLKVLKSALRANVTLPLSAYLVNIHVSICIFHILLGFFLVPTPVPCLNDQATY